MEFVSVLSGWFGAASQEPAVKGELTKTKDVVEEAKNRSGGGRGEREVAGYVSCQPQDGRVQTHDGVGSSK